MFYQGNCCVFWLCWTFDYLGNLFWIESELIWVSVCKCLLNDHLITVIRPTTILSDCNNSGSYIFMARNVTRGALSQVLMAHTCNPSYLGGWDQEDLGSRSDWANSLWDTISKIIRAKWTRAMVQVVKCLICKCKAPSSNTSPTKGKKREWFYILMEPTPYIKVKLGRERKIKCTGACCPTIASVFVLYANELCLFALCHIYDYFGRLSL
jgi:hypothetical protein